MCVVWAAGAFAGENALSENRQKKVKWFETTKPSLFVRGRAVPNSEISLWFCALVCANSMLHPANFIEAPKFNQTDYRLPITDLKLPKGQVAKASRFLRFSKPGWLEPSP
jgi:hypothetical protein